jgi:hypothetical protein
VPHGQLRIAFPAENWMVTPAGGLTVTVVIPGAEAQAPVVAVTLYRPEALVVALASEGLWLVEVKPFGPVQL